MRNIANEIPVQKIEKEVVLLEDINGNPFNTITQRRINLRNYDEFERAAKKGIPIYKETIKISENCQRVTYYILVSFEALLNAAI